MLVSTRTPSTGSERLTAGLDGAAVVLRSSNKIRGLGWRARWRDLAHRLVFVSVIVGFWSDDVLFDIDNY